MAIEEARKPRPRAARKCPSKCSPGSRLPRPIAAFQLTAPAGTFGSPARQQQQEEAEGCWAVARLSIRLQPCNSQEGLQLCSPQVPPSRVEARTRELGGHRKLLAVLHLPLHLQQLGAVRTKGPNVQACEGGMGQQGDAMSSCLQTPPTEFAKLGTFHLRRWPFWHPTACPPWHSLYRHAAHAAPLKGSVLMKLPSRTRW